MRKLSFIALFGVLLSCNSSSPDKETKKDSTVVSKDTSVAPPKTDSAAGVTLTIDPVKYPGSVAYAVFQQDGKTLFYYNVDNKKGSISINGKKYDFTSYSHEINGSTYELKSGDDLTIEVTGTKYHDYANPEPGIMKGKAALVTIILGTAKLATNNVDVIDGTNAD